ncbi:sulfatase [Pontiellaceae bacterium B12227]|nr:sulfatase [Pontiellaceae bacterium B12227]
MTMKYTAWMMAALLALVGAGNQVQAADSGMKGSRPNVIFFLGDDQSKFDHAAYGNTAVPTPTTGAFAKEGLVFERAFTGQAICAPSRSMLYTGLYPVRNGCFINHSKIRKGIKTLPLYLKELGYTVILAGKSHVQPSNQFTWSKHFEPVKKEGIPRPWIPIEEIDAFLANPGDKPFCLIIASAFPHGPYIENGPFKDSDVVLPPYVAESESTLKKATQYYANIVEKESEFDSVLKMLDQHGLKNNSIVFYSDDHGASRGKFSVYDSGLNVAFMVCWPGKIKPGRTDSLASFADFVPTVIELAGGTPEGLDGKSLLPILENGDGKIHDYVYGVTVNQGIINRHVFPQRSIHDGRYHYIYNFNSMERIERERAAGKQIDYFIELGAKKHEGSTEEMLFDTHVDPHELNNVANNPEMAEVKKRLKKQLFQWMKKQNDYLTENAPIPFLEVGKRFGLDHMDNKYSYSIPEEKVGSLKGKTIDPHASTASKGK